MNTLTELRWRFYDWRHDKKVRCRIGIHFPALWDPFSGYMEPPDEWWYCAECRAEAYPLSWRPRIWLFEKSPISEQAVALLIRWFDWKHPRGLDRGHVEMCARHHRGLHECSQSR